MAIIGFSDKAVAHIGAAITAEATQIQIQDLEYSAVLSSPGVSVFLMLRGPVNRELVKVDIDASVWGGGLSDYLTVERGQGGTVAQSWPIGSMMFATTHEDHYNEIIQRGKNRVIDYNPNEILAPLFAGEEIYQDAPAGCERWWKSYNGVNPYWDIITGAPCGTETWTDIGWDYDILKSSPAWALKKDFHIDDTGKRQIPGACFDNSRNTLFISFLTDSEIWKSIDGGGAWVHVRTDADSNGIYAVAYNPNYDTLVYGNDGGYIFVSDDGGGTWVESDFAGSIVFDFAYSSSTHTLIAASRNGNIYRSTDGGYTWDGGQWLGDSRVYSATFDSSRNRFIAGVGDSKGTIWVSTNDGIGWVEKKRLSLESPAQTKVLSLCYDSENDVIIAGTYNYAQLWISSDGGETWTLKKTLRDETPAQFEIGALFYNPDTKVIYAGSMYGGQIWVSSNGGEAWAMEQEIDTGNADVYIDSFAYDSYHQKLIAGAGSNIGPAQLWQRGN